MFNTSGLHIVRIKMILDSVLTIVLVIATLLTRISRKYNPDVWYFKIVAKQNAGSILL